MKLVTFEKDGRSAVGLLNAAGPGGQAVVAIGSRKADVTGANRQSVVIGGSVTNIAGPGVTSKIEIDHR